MNEPDEEFVEAIPIEPVTTTLEADLQRVKILAELMDSKFEILGVRFGMDAIVGLVPVVGDTLSLLPSVYPLMVAKRHGLGRALQFRMGWNIAVDWLVGLIPVLGDVLDVASKAILKNSALLHKAAEKRTRLHGTR